MLFGPSEKAASAGHPGEAVCVGGFRLIMVVVSLAHELAHCRAFSSKDGIGKKSQKAK